MWFFKRIKIRKVEIGLVFRDGEFRGLLGRGTHWFVDLRNTLRVDVVSQRDPWLRHEDLDVIVKSGTLADRAEVLDLKDYQRALVWVDGRFSAVLPAGLFAYWTTHREVRVELIDARKARCDHADARLIARLATSTLVDVVNVPRHAAGVLFIDGAYVETLAPGQYLFWKGAVESKVVEIDLRDSVCDIGGQEIITADKFTLRVNAQVTYRVTDPRRMLAASDDARQALYREAQLGLRAVVGARELDALLADKDAASGEWMELLAKRAGELGLEVVSCGLRDVILPGDMKELLNRVIEAKKAAEANLIARREETAAIRSQANTAKLLAENPTLMRLRELEVLEKIASAGKLNVVTGDKGLAERMLNLL